MATDSTRDGCHEKIKPKPSSSQTANVRQERKQTFGDGTPLSNEKQLPHYLKPTLSSLGGVVACMYCRRQGSKEKSLDGKKSLVRRLSLEKPSSKSSQHQKGQSSTPPREKQLCNSYPLTRATSGSIIIGKDEEIAGENGNALLLVKETVHTEKTKQEQTETKDMELLYDKHCVLEKLENCEPPRLTEKPEEKDEDGVDQMINSEEVDHQKSNTHENSQASNHIGSQGMNGNRKISKANIVEEGKARRLNFRRGSYIDVVEDNGREAENVVLKKQEGNEKKEFIDYNGVIEETTSKLVEQKKNKVLALAGAFETVISLHESEGLVQNKKD